MTNVTVEVIIHYNNRKFSNSEPGVRLNDDDVQISASGLAYGLIEDVWGAVVEDEDE